MTSDDMLSEMTNAATIEDGAGVQFTLKTAGEKTLDVILPAAQLTMFIHDLMQLASLAAKVRTRDTPVSAEVAPPTKVAESPRLTDLAIAESADGTKMFLVVRLHDVDVSFEASKPKLTELVSTLKAAVLDIADDKGIRH